MAENGARMSKYGLYPVMVLVFIATFLSLIYGWASNGYLHETSIPNKPGVTAHHEAADEHHGKTPAPSHTPEAVSSTATPAVSATPGTSTPGTATPATATPAEATPATATPAATGTPAVTATPAAGSATPGTATPAGSATPVTAP